MADTESKPANAYQPWTSDDDKLLCFLHSAKSTNELAYIFGRTEGGIEARLKHLGQADNSEHNSPYKDDEDNDNDEQSDYELELEEQQARARIEAAREQQAQRYEMEHADYYHERILEDIRQYEWDQEEL